MLGSRSVTPAISIAAGPSPARICAASATVRGARKSNHGSRIIALGLLAVAALPGRRDINRLRVRDGRELLGAHSRVLAFRFQVQGPENFFRRDRQFVDAHAD